MGRFKDLAIELEYLQSEKKMTLEEIDKWLKGRVAEIKQSNRPKSSPALSDSKKSA